MAPPFVGMVTPGPFKVPGCRGRSGAIRPNLKQVES